ncbi:MAG: RsmB/NOP family class I SAM-dependent RNA methyltransferase [Alphaproteobacteria bacterium]
MEARTDPRAGARGRAALLLREVLDRGRPLDAALEEDTDLAALDARDRAFARLLVATVLRRLGQIDAALATRIARPLPARAALAQHVLRLGAAQLAYLGTPPWAAIDSAVQLARAFGLGTQAGLVNAVLRALVREPPAVLAADAPDAARRNTPDALWQRWSAAYGHATALKIATAHLAEPPLDLSARDDAAGWAERLGAALLPTGSLRHTGGGAVTGLPGFAEGAWWVQDAAAALPARLLGAVAGKRVVDLCAAPGGKTLQLAAAGAAVTAIDIEAARLARVEANLARTGLAARTVRADARTWRPEAPAEAVLLDAPCSATGTVRRHPDILYRKGEVAIRAMPALQDALLDAAAAMLAPGGTLVYAVCSLEPEEGPARIAALLARNAGLRRLPVRAREVPALAALEPSALTPEGAVRTLPCHWAERGGMDGFYIARLQRGAT